MTDRQTSGRTDRQTDGHTNRQTDRVDNIVASQIKTLLTFSTNLTGATNMSYQIYSGTDR